MRRPGTRRLLPDADALSDLLPDDTSETSPGTARTDGGGFSSAAPISAKARGKLPMSATAPGGATTDRTADSSDAATGGATTATTQTSTDRRKRRVAAAAARGAPNVGGGGAPPAPPAVSLTAAPTGGAPAPALSPRDLIAAQRVLLPNAASTLASQQALLDEALFFGCDPLQAAACAGASDAASAPSFGDSGSRGTRSEAGGGGSSSLSSAGLLPPRRAAAGGGDAARWQAERDALLSGLTSRRQQLLTPRTGASIAQRFAPTAAGAPGAAPPSPARDWPRAVRFAARALRRLWRVLSGGPVSRAVVRGARRYAVGRYATNLIGAALVAALASAVVVVGPIVGSVLFVPLERLWVNYLCDMRIALCVSLLSFGAIIGLFNHLGWLE